MFKKIKQMHEIINRIIIYTELYIHKYKYEYRELNEKWIHKDIHYRDIHIELYMHTKNT